MSRCPSRFSEDREKPFNDPVVGQVPAKMCFVPLNVTQSSQLDALRDHILHQGRKPVIEIAMIAASHEGDPRSSIYSIASGARSASAPVNPL